MPIRANGPNPVFRFPLPPISELVSGRKKLVKDKNQRRIEEFLVPKKRQRQEPPSSEKKASNFLQSEPKKASEDYFSDIPGVQIIEKDVDMESLPFLPGGSRLEYPPGVEDRPPPIRKQHFPPTPPPLQKGILKNKPPPPKKQRKRVPYQPPRIEFIKGFKDEEQDASDFNIQSFLARRVRELGGYRLSAPNSGRRVPAPSAYFRPSPLHSHLADVKSRMQDMEKALALGAGKKEIVNGAKLKQISHANIVASKPASNKPRPILPESSQKVSLFHLNLLSSDQSPVFSEPARGSPRPSEPLSEIWDFLMD